MMIHIRVIAYNSFGPCGWSFWAKETDLNKELSVRGVPYNAMVWLDRGNQYDRYLGYENYNMLTA